MGLKLVDKWIWDSWFVFDGTHYHAYYLSASRALGDPHRRHRHPIVGHAISTNLTNWTVVVDALIVSESPAFDSYTTWTGSVVKGDDGLWWMYYTGTSREDGGDIQTIGAATSSDLYTWTKLGTEALVKADERWYEKLGQSSWPDEAWRDPWVFKAEAGRLIGGAKYNQDAGIAELANSQALWHMLITARSNEGPVASRGVMGHAISVDQRSWKVLPPLGAVTKDFGQLEVFQFEIVDGVPTVLFCCGWREISPERQASFGKRDASYSFSVDQDLTAIDYSRAKGFEHALFYAGRLIEGPDGWVLIGFLNNAGPNGEFVGELSDPVAVTSTIEHGLVPKG
ncbi:MAG: hypothetical protein RLZ28_12 [Actinomycetota bacterium]